MEIHYLEADYNRTSKSGSIRVVYHVLNDKVNNNYPGVTESKVILNIEQEEIDAIISGSVYEYVRTYERNLTDVGGVAALKAEIKATYPAVQTKVMQMLNTNYKLYGDTETYP